MISFFVDGISYLLQMLNFRCPIQLNEGASFQDLDTAKLLSEGSMISFFSFLSVSKHFKILKCFLDLNDLSKFQGLHYRQNNNKRLFLKIGSLLM